MKRFSHGVLERLDDIIVAVVHVAIPRVPKGCLSALVLDIWVSSTFKQGLEYIFKILISSDHEWCFALQNAGTRNGGCA